MNTKYRALVEQIKIEGEDFAENAMKGVYLEQKAALDEIHNLIGKIYIKYGKQGALFLSDKQKKALTSEIKQTLTDMGAQLAESEVKQVDELLGNVFSTTYYKNIYTMESGMVVNVTFPILKQEFIDAAINAKYKGEFFSDRIWANKGSMIDSLQSSLIDAMKGKMTIDEVGKKIEKQFNSTAYESQRLVATEAARVQTAASEEMGRAVGVKEVMWSATLDSLTAPEDGDLDGKVWGIDEDHPLPPLHPECRCALINVPYSGWNPTQRRDNELKELIAYTNYNDWLKAKNISQ